MAGTRIRQRFPLSEDAAFGTQRCASLQGFIVCRTMASSLGLRHETPHRFQTSAIGAGDGSASRGDFRHGTVMRQSKTDKSGKIRHRIRTHTS